MYMDERELNGATILDCYGRFDQTDHDQFVEIIESLHGRGCPHLVINLSSLYSLDPKAISFLHFAHEYFHSHSCHVTLVSPLSTVRNELNLSHVPDTIPTHASIYDALHRPHADLANIDSLVNL